MSTRKPALLLFLASLLIVQLACSLLPAGTGTPDTAATLNALYTVSARTLEAQATQYGYTATPGLPQPTAAGSLFPGQPTQKTSTPIVRCDAAAFVSDLSYPDGSVVARGAAFTKTWRLKNVGTCSWTAAYALVFASGDAMGGPSAVALPGSVNPGQTLDLSVRLTAPNSAGKYRGYWKLRNASNALFGVGDQADTAFWVDIKVSGASYVAYDFVAKYCDANWENNNKDLPCPGEEGDDKGYVIKLNHPKLENGSSQGDPGLLTVPRDASNGVIRGQYPAFTVKSGDRFRARVYCRYNADKCSVTFRLDYLNHGQVRTLGSWDEVYEGQYYTVDLDLSDLAGEKLKFILVVTANGSARDDEAIWLNPHIQRQGSPPD